MLCSRGYSDQLAGLSASMILIAGFLAAFPLGYISMKVHNTRIMVILLYCLFIDWKDDSNNQDSLFTSPFHPCHYNSNFGNTKHWMGRDVGLLCTRYLELWLFGST